MNRFLVTLLLIAGLCLAGISSLGCGGNQSEEISYSINLLSPLPYSIWQVGDVLEVEGEYYLNDQPVPLGAQLAISATHWSNYQGGVVASSHPVGNATVLNQGKFSVACLIDTDWSGGIHSVQIVDNKTGFLYESDHFLIIE